MFFRVAGLTEWLNVRKGIRTAVADRNDVVRREQDFRLLPMTHEASAVVTSLQLGPFCSGDGCTGLRDGCSTLLRRTIDALFVRSLPGRRCLSVQLWVAFHRAILSLAQNFIADTSTVVRRTLVDFGAVRDSVGTLRRSFAVQALMASKMRVIPTRGESFERQGSSASFAVFHAGSVAEWGSV